MPDHPRSWSHNQADLNCCDNSFTVEAELHLTAEQGRVGNWKSVFDAARR
jgi:hypothetical protein